MKTPLTDVFQRYQESLGKTAVAGVLSLSALMTGCANFVSKEYEESMDFCLDPAKFDEKFNGKRGALETVYIFPQAAFHMTCYMMQGMAYVAITSGALVECGARNLMYNDPDPGNPDSTEDTRPVFCQKLEQ